VAAARTADLLISERDVRQALLVTSGNTWKAPNSAAIEVERMEGGVLERDPFVLDAEPILTNGTCPCKKSYNANRCCAYSTTMAVTTTWIKTA